eukprot:1508700-Ditylum_brightwellii.AAC.1
MTMTPTTSFQLSPSADNFKNTTECLKKTSDSKLDTPEDTHDMDIINISELLVKIEESAKEHQTALKYAKEVERQITTIAKLQQDQEIRNKIIESNVGHVTTQG